MNEHEETFIVASVVKEKQSRCRFQLSSTKQRHRNEFLNRLHQCRDLNENRFTWLARRATHAEDNQIVADLLRQKGSPDLVYVMASSCEADGQTLPLHPVGEPFFRVFRASWPTIAIAILWVSAMRFSNTIRKRVIRSAQATVRGCLERGVSFSRWQYERSANPCSMAA